jgi:hypothetical protein
MSGRVRLLSNRRGWTGSRRALSSSIHLVTSTGALITLFCLPSFRYFSTSFSPETAGCYQPGRKIRFLKFVKSLLKNLSFCWQKPTACFGMAGILTNQTVKNSICTVKYYFKNLEQGIHCNTILWESIRIRVGTKVFVFSRKFSRKPTFRFSEIFVAKIRNIRENTKHSRKFSRKLRYKKALQQLWTKILFLIIHKQKSAKYIFWFAETILKNTVSYNLLLFVWDFLSKSFAKSFAKFL